ncbi:MAG: OmpH family outer membrane protein [Planctomycetes bacterium]|nr:OmpH family outer membrane protein [Planctomycetota bacterium]
MKRSSAYLAGVLGFGGMLLLASSSKAQGPGGAAPAPGGAPPAVATARPTIAVFNMAAVMRDYGKAKYQVQMLNNKRSEMTKELMAWRAQYIKLQQETQDPKVLVAEREEKAKQMVGLARQIEDKDREVNKVLNEDATKIISTLYDDIKTVVDKTAEMNGYHIVFAYPDAVTPEEANSPMVKELKLKPPAASPFYVAKHVDLTGVVIQTLNAWYPAPAVPAGAAPAPPGPGPAPAPPGPAPK